MTDTERFDQGLQDLIFITERLHADLAHELERSEKIGKAVNQIQRINDAAQDQIEETMYRLGIWKDDTAIARQKPSKPEETARQIFEQMNGRVQ